MRVTHIFITVDSMMLSIFRNLGPGTQNPQLDLCSMARGSLIDFVQSAERAPHLRSVYVRGKWFGDPEIQALSTISQLEHVHINFSNVSDEGMAQLAKLRNLHSVTIEHFPEAITWPDVPALGEQMEDYVESAAQLQLTEVSYGAFLEDFARMSGLSNVTIVVEPSGIVGHRTVNHFRNLRPDVNFKVNFSLSPR